MSLRSYILDKKKKKKSHLGCEQYVKWPRGTNEKQLNLFFLTAFFTCVAAVMVCGFDISLKLRTDYDH